MILMRDGIRLHVALYTPTAAPAPLPIMLLRTPYGIDDYAGTFHDYLKELADEGYIFAFEDIRGRHESEGQFVMQRAPRDRKDPKAIDESTDTYDTIDWLVKHVPNNNGRVGELGISYDGWTTVMAMLDPHPALKAVSPQASPVDMFIGDDFHHNGAFRLSYGFEYATMMETNKDQAQFAFDQYDTYNWYLRLGALSNADAKYLHGKIPTWRDFASHPNYDQFWQRQTALPYLDHVNVPTLNVAGWWDQEDFYGPVTIFEALEKHDTAHMNYLVVGPWNHGGWSDPEGQKLGAIDFGAPTSADFRKNVQAPFFAYFLKDHGARDFPKALTFEGGANKWRRHDSWPPKSGVTQEHLYFQAAGGASFDAPKPTATDSGFDSYVSDPAHPVPYRHRPIPPTYQPGGSGWTTWLVEDQRFVDHRPDVLTFETPPLTHDVTVAGAITAHLFAATTGSDADWIVKLIDVYPDVDSAAPAFGGYELMVANDVFRGRFRDGFVTPHPITPNHVDEYKVDLHTQDYRFLKGHRIMVQVQSTWFPIIDRNPQHYVPNIFEAKDADFQIARQRIYRSGAHASYIDLPVEGQTTQ
jgi:putative CocE/NonD family hydrolase